VKKKTLQYCLIAPSGSGKSTIAKLIGEFFHEFHVPCEILKLADPIYKLQKLFYEQAQIEINASQQNHNLMESIANNLRLLNPRAIIDNFLQRYDRLDVPVIINDDVRDVDVDWPILKSLGFRTLLIEAPENLRKERLLKRGDLLVSVKSQLDENFLRMEPDETIINNGKCLNELRYKIREWVAGVVRDL
jgi:dephospho-CoA kinase